MVKNPPANAGDAGLIPGSGRSPEGGNGNPLQYSCLENSVDRGTWWATVHGVSKSRTWLSDQTPMNNMCQYMLCVCIVQTLRRWSHQRNLTGVWWQSSNICIAIMKLSIHTLIHSFIHSAVTFDHLFFSDTGRWQEQVTASVLGQSSGRNRWTENCKHSLIACCIEPQILPLHWVSVRISLLTKFTTACLQHYFVCRHCIQNTLNSNYWSLPA